MNTQAQKKQVAEQIWLNFYNDNLLKQGLITEHVRNVIALKISNRKPSATK